jgi:RNA polymerase sigma-70 factor (family 1)
MIGLIRRHQGSLFSPSQFYVFDISLVRTGTKKHQISYSKMKLKNTFALKLCEMSDLPDSYERILIEKLKNEDKAAFTVIFTRYYKDLVRFSFCFTKNADASEELVQEVFLKLWENRNFLSIHSSLKSFLLKSVQNRSIDLLRHLNIRNKYASVVLDNPLLSANDTENYILHSELELNFNRAMVKIPVEYAEVFRMSRIEALGYHEIAEKLGVSVRTVEVRVGKALGMLREELKDFLVLLLIIYQLFH